MSSFDKVLLEVEEGIKGRNRGIPMGFDRLNRYIGIRKRILTMIFGASGSGKSAFLHTAYILNPFDYIIAHPELDIKFKVILFSMERSSVYILAKWISRKIFLDYGILIPIPKLLGWWKDKLTKDEHDLFLSCKDYTEQLLSTVDIIEGPQNPTGIFKYVRDYAEKHGKVEEITEYKKVYIPNNPEEIVIVAEDHLGLTKTEKNYPSKKESIDKLSEYNQQFRDFYGYTPVTVSQLNRNLSNPLFTKVQSFEPHLDDVKESGNPGEASDVVVSLFDPMRYRTTDEQYKAENFIDQSTGANYFRKLKILKNSYGEDSIGVGLAFQGATGSFKELPKPSEMGDFDYNSLFNQSYFL